MIRSDVRRLRTIHRLNVVDHFGATRQRHEIFVVVLRWRHLVLEQAEHVIRVFDAGVSVPAIFCNLLLTLPVGTVIERRVKSARSVNVSREVIRSPSHGVAGPSAHVTVRVIRVTQAIAAVVPANLAYSVDVSRIVRVDVGVPVLYSLSDVARIADRNGEILGSSQRRRL